MESLKTILYFSIFKHPLTLEEIYSYYPDKDRDKIEAELNRLTEQNVIFEVDGFYLSDCDPDCIEKRRQGNLMAIPALEKARERAALIAKFPFVEGVGVSGSLSKGYYDNRSDIDFFVITKPGKVWISRTLLMLYKKIFLLNSRRYFCINYFMSSANLELEEKNRFTATEIKTLIPFQGKDTLEAFYRHNEWISNIFGPFSPDLESVPNIKKPIFSKALEATFDNRLGNMLDDGFKKFTLGFWRLKFRKMDNADFSVALKSTKNVSKHHPANFQKRVILSLNEKYEELHRKHNIELPKEYA
ncbi:MAG: nucleotidyltransferase domain-containing protein [Flavobacterium sp.]|nr:MAG: nucleotidyltransferase domain-containing protein [Flavobacterium sp.]